MQLIEYIENKNKIIKNRDLNAISGVTTQMVEKAKKWDFYLGMYCYDEKTIYGYLWVKEIFENLQGVQNESFYYKNEDANSVENTKKKYKKKKIPKSLREKCWKTYVGEEHSRCYCICCGSNIIGMMQFECGHIISEKNGGKTELANLLPICSTCNKSMSSKNMDIFIETYHNEQYDSFKKRSYCCVI